MPSLELATVLAAEAIHVPSPYARWEPPGEACVGTSVPAIHVVPFVEYANPDPSLDATNFPFAKRTVSIPAVSPVIVLAVHDPVAPVVELAAFPPEAVTTQIPAPYAIPE